MLVATSLLFSIFLQPKPVDFLQMRTDSDTVALISISYVDLHSLHKYICYLNQKENSATISIGVEAQNVDYT